MACHVPVVFYSSLLCSPRVGWLRWLRGQRVTVGNASGRQSTNVPHAGKTSAVLNGVCPHTLCNCSDKKEYLFHSVLVLAVFLLTTISNLLHSSP